MIEPSFGVGRIIYCMLEHCFYTRPGSEDKHVFRRVALWSCVRSSSAQLSKRALLLDIRPLPCYTGMGTILACPPSCAAAPCLAWMLARRIPL